MKNNNEGKIPNKKTKVESKTKSNVYPIADVESVQTLELEQKIINEFDEEKQIQKIESKQQT